MNGAKKIIDVVGAGPAGLVAAINLAKAGFAVTLHESASSVGHRFHGDFQGIENWRKESSWDSVPQRKCLLLLLRKLQGTV
jgi:predicted flavoprotein YhiN